MLLIRGGNWNNGALDGAFAFNVNNAVSYAGNANIGFRLLSSKFCQSVRFTNQLSAKQGKRRLLPSDSGKENIKSLDSSVKKRELEALSFF